MDNSSNNNRRKLFQEQKNIYEMILNEDIKELKEYIKEKFKLVDYSKSKTGSTPLTLAAKVGNEEVVKLLLDYTKSIDNVSKALEQALHFSDNKNEKVVEMLIKKYSEMKKQIKQVKLAEKKSELKTILEESDENLKEEKSDLGSSIIKENEERSTTQSIQEKPDNSKTERRKIFQEQYNIYKVILNQDNNELKQHPKSMYKLVDNSRNMEGATPLTLAVKLGNEESVKLLLVHTNSLDNVNNALEQALRDSKNKNPKIVDLLIEKHTEIRQKIKRVKLAESRSSLRTIEEESKKNEHVELLDITKKPREKEDIPSNGRRIIVTPSNEAFKATFENDVSTLIKIVKSNPFLVDSICPEASVINDYPGKKISNNETPLTLAIKLKHTDCVNVLIKYSKSIENINNAIEISSMLEFRSKTVRLRTRKNEIIALDRKKESKIIAEVMKDKKRNQPRLSNID